MPDVAIYNFSDAAVKKTIIGYIRSLQGPHRFTCEKVLRQRSLSQNAMYWGFVVTPIAARLAELSGERVTPEAAHEMLKGQLLQVPIVNRETGELVCHITGSTAVLDTAAFSEWLDRVEKFSAEKLDLKVPTGGMDF